MIDREAMGKAAKKDWGLIILISLGIAGYAIGFSLQVIATIGMWWL